VCAARPASYSCHLVNSQVFLLMCSSEFPGPASPPSGTRAYRVGPVGHGDRGRQLKVPSSSVAGPVEASTDFGEAHQTRCAEDASLDCLGQRGPWVINHVRENGVQR
jgi:hypothetical protein